MKIKNANYGVLLRGTKKILIANIYSLIPAHLYSDYFSYVNSFHLHNLPKRDDHNHLYFIYGETKALSS